MGAQAYLELYNTKNQFKGGRVINGPYLPNVAKRLMAEAQDAISCQSEYALRIVMIDLGECRIDENKSYLAMARARRGGNAVRRGITS